MKKIWFALTCILVLNAETAQAQPVNIYTAVRNAATEFYLNLENGTRIAVVAMETGSARMSRYLIDEMTIALASTGEFIVADRNQLDRAAQELHFLTYQVTDGVEARSIGRFMGAQAIVMGILAPTQDFLYFRASVIDVETAAVLGVYYTNVQNNRTIAFLRGEAYVHTERDEMIIYVHAQRDVMIIYAPNGEAEDPARFWSVGLSIGSAFDEPILTGTLQATLAPLANSFVRIGADLNLITNIWVSHYSVSIFAHYAFFRPFTWSSRGGGWNIGAGGSFMVAEYHFYDLAVPRRVLAADFVTGFNFGNVFDISYTLRTNFSTVFSHRVSIGLTHRFRARGR